MKAVLVDSDILIEVGRGRDTGIGAQWRQLAVSDVVAAVSAVSVAELWHGVRVDEEEALRGLFLATLCLPVDEAIGERAGGYLRKFRRSHGVELADALIGATAAEFGLPLWTRNRRHYPMAELAFFG